MDTVAIARVPTIVAATAICEMLQGNGINCEMAGGSDTVFPGEVMGAYAVVVDAAQADRARALIDALEGEAESGELVDDAVAAEADGERDGQTPPDD